MTDIYIYSDMLYILVKKMEVKRMVKTETMIRLKEDVWEMINLEKQLGESMSDTIGRVFQERFDKYEQILTKLEEDGKL